MQEVTASQKPTRGGASSGRRDLASIPDAGFPSFLSGSSDLLVLGTRGGIC